MRDEQKRILEMLAEGKISVDDAERLMEKLGTASDEPRGSGARSGSSRPKYLRVHVDSSDGDKVDVRIPLALIRTGIKLTGVMPNHVSERLSEQGVDLARLSELDGDELYEALRDMQVDVNSGDDTVRVFCE
jgi:hypothetical protein